jgi:hypothetical protein
MIADEPFVEAYGFIDKAALYLQVGDSLSLTGTAYSHSGLPAPSAVHQHTPCGMSIRHWLQA